MVEEKTTDIIKDFIGIFPNAASKEYCDKVINRFDTTQEARESGRGGIVTRQQLEGISTTKKDSSMYFFESEPNLIVVQNNISLVQEFNEITWKCYGKFKEEYGFLDSVMMHKLAYSIKIQKYKPGQGYHVWHCDSNGMDSCRRILVTSLFLNTVEEGGETEFLYQSKRVPAVQGTLILFPAGWTHPHRGNPPLKGNKYIITTWLEFMDMPTEHHDI